MKILSNKRYREIVGEIADLIRDKGDAKETCKKYITEIENLKKEIIKFKTERKFFIKTCSEYELKQIELLKEISSLNGATGGYTRQINKLKRELDETKRKLEDSLTDKYIVKKIPMGKLPKGQVMQIKSNARNDKITRKVYEELQKEAKQ